MNPRILVADDDPDLREIIRLTLQRDGYEVIEAADGDQAVARAIDSAPSLILLDMLMPGIDGFDTCRRLKSDRRTDAVPVIFISGHSDQRMRSQVFRLGAEDYLYKPLDPRDLSRRVRMAIQRRGVNSLFGSGPIQS
ncbi:MAG TPA: response regulator [Anaerolineae bacterium]|nr:response regulator [Anaerolineae bacterium]